MNEIRGWVTISILLLILLPAFLPDPVPEVEPVRVEIGEPLLLTRPAAIPVAHVLPEPVEQARAYLDMKATELHIGEFQEPHALTSALDERVEPTPVWTRPVWTSPGSYPRNVEFWRAWVDRPEYSWPVDEALAIIGCESSGDSDVISHTNDWGLFQHHYPFWAERSAKAGYPNSNPLDPKINIAVAHWLYQSKGGSWTDWVCADILGLN